MVNVNPDDQVRQSSYKDTLNRYTKDSLEKFCIELFFKLADTNKDGNIDEFEFNTLEKNLSEKSVFEDGVFKNKEIKDYVKDYNKSLNLDSSQMLEFSKEDFAKLKYMKTGISQSMFDKFKEFYNIRLGNGNVNTQLGINGKLSLTPWASSKQDVTGNCYLLTAVNLLSHANDGDLSGYIEPDGKGGGIISYKGTKNYQGGTFDAKVSERELNLIRKYQEDNSQYCLDQDERRYREHSILSKGDDDVLAIEIAEMKRNAYSLVKLDFEGNIYNKVPKWLKNKKTELLNNYIEGLSSEDKNELSKYIFRIKNLEPLMNDLICEMPVSDNDIKSFKFDDIVTQKIKNNPKVFEELKSKFPKECLDADGNEKEMLDDECIKKINDYIKSWQKLGFNDRDMLEHRRFMFEQLLKILKFEDGVQSGEIELPSISDTEIKNYEPTESDLKLLYPQNKTSEVFINKIDKYLMDQFSNLEIKDEVMLKNYHELISNGGYSKDVLKALAGAESIDSGKYKSIYATFGYGVSQKDKEQFEAKKKTEIMEWIGDAKAKGYSHVVAIIANKHAVLFKSYDEQKNRFICYNPLNMNREEGVIIDNISRLTGIKLPSKK